MRKKIYWVQIEWGNRKSDCCMSLEQKRMWMFSWASLKHRVSYTQIYYITWTNTKQALGHSEKNVKTRETYYIGTSLQIVWTLDLCVWYFFVDFAFVWLTNSYPAAWAEALLSWAFGVRGGTGDPPDSSDGVFDKNRLPPSSETSVIGELYVFRISHFVNRNRVFVYVWIQTK